MSYVPVRDTIGENFHLSHTVVKERVSICGQKALC